MKNKKVKFNMLLQALNSQSKSLDRIEKILKAQIVTNLADKMAENISKLTKIEGEKVINKSDFERSKKTIENLLKGNDGNIKDAI